MRLLAACALTLAMAASAGAQGLNAPPRTSEMGEECMIALAAVRDRGSPGDFAIWPMLGVQAGDDRMPLDCAPLFRSMGLPRPDVYAGVTLTVTRPVFAGPDTATVLVDASRGLQTLSRTRYGLKRDAAGWRVTDKAEESIEAALRPLI